MEVTIGRWGFSIQVSSWLLHLYIGDIYIHAPGLGELAWNRTGLSVNRLPLR